MYKRQIQDQVEEAFVEEGFIEEYKAFKNYRQKRAVARDCFSSRQHRLMKTLENFGIKDSKEVNEKRENANINGDSAMGMMLQYGSTLTKAYTTSYCLDPKVAAAHENGDIHIQDVYKRQPCQFVYNYGWITVGRMNMRDKIRFDAYKELKTFNIDDL